MSLPLYPTKKEADELAALVPTNQQTTIQTEQHLAEFIQFCQREDVRHFLFNKDPFHLSYLASPLISNNAVSGAFTTTTVENNNTRQFSNHVYSKFFLAQAFTSGSLTFGFGASEYVVNPATSWDTTSLGFCGRSRSRFVRDDAQDVLITVLDFPEIDMVLVDYDKFMNSTGQLQCTSRFRRRKLQSIYESGIFNLESLKTALISFNACFQFRDCPVCSGGELRCNCALPTLKPRHPFDTKAYFANMRRRLGTFHGVEGVTVYDGGRKVHHTSAGCKTAVLGGRDFDLIERLRAWSICDSVAAVDPRQSLIELDSSNCGADLPDSAEGNTSNSQRQNERSTVDLDVRGDRNPQATTWRDMEELLKNLDSQEELARRRALDTTSVQRNGRSENSQISKAATHPGPQEATDEGPMKSADTANVSSTPHKNETKDKELVLKLKAELRKEKNRLCAQRSNMKKKAENDARKMEIKLNKEKASLLRATEHILREENLRLRQAVSEQSHEDK